VVLRLPPWNAIQYARGYETTSVAAVATAANQIERRNCVWYSETAWLKLAKCHVSRNPL
jgi:hypothetical protein